MPSQSTLAEHQLAILQWIADGCPDQAIAASGYKQTAVALQNRRLVKITRKGGRWAATITDDGTFYLAHGRYRHQPAIRTAAAPPPPISTPVSRPPTVRRVQPTVQFVEEVIAAGGTLRVHRHEDRRDFHALVASAIRYNKVPDGKLLTIDTDGGYENLVIRLQDPPEWQTRVLTLIVVPRQLRKPHPILNQIQAHPDFEALTQLVRPRALRLLHALVTAAESRGYSVTTRDVAGPYARPRDRTLLGIEIHGHAIGVRLSQQSDRVPHGPTKTELREKERYSWTRIPTHDSIPSDRLSITVVKGREYRQSTWNDGKRGRLEDKLAEVLQEIELRAAHFEERRLAEEHRRQERRRQWEAAMDQARVDLQEAHRASLLRESAAQWQQVTLLRSYLEQMREVANSLPPGAAKDDALGWVDWCDQYIEQIDPLAGALAMPEELEPTPERLRPLLGGWSPYSPD